MIASVAPTSDSTSPSIRNGTRMRQFVAPTRRMIPISFRRANIPIRNVFATRTTALTSMITAAEKMPSEKHAGHRRADRSSRSR